MYIKELTIENYKGFKGEHILKFDKNLVFFVGDNNSGKSTIFESIDFLKTGLPQTKVLEDIKNKNTDEPVCVTLKIQGDIKNIINDFSQSKYLSYVYKESGVETLLARRTSEVSTIKQKGKEVEINIKKITLWNAETKQFENPAGIDSVFKTLFETQFVWADTNPDDISDFGSTKICGRLLTSTIGDFFESKQWGQFVDIHKETFQEGPNSLASRTKDLEDRIQSLITNQYGSADIKFNFSLPEVASFIKSGGININDGTDTNSKDKGTGMQRALALALIQIYSEEICKHPKDSKKIKPLFLFIDEPETFLHPIAQKKLLSALDAISEVQQVFITTHSPYLLKSFQSDKHVLFSCEKLTSTNKVESSIKLDLFGNSSPTWGEINYFAYSLLTVEFHNELYGFVQAKAIKEDFKYEKIEEFDKYLDTKGAKMDIEWIHEKSSGDKKYKTTLQTYIRNTIHHTENKKILTILTSN